MIEQLDIELFGGCNYACKMCPQSTGREKDFLKSLPIEVYKKIIDDAVNHGITHVSLHGGGEITLYKHYVEAIKYAKSKNLICYTFSNGYNFNTTVSKNMIAAGIDFVRFSAIGYDKESYKEWMSVDAYELVRSNIANFTDLGGNAELYHLILNIDNEDHELNQYRTNWSEYLDVPAEVWRMHSWTGEFGSYSRQQQTQRSCGKPFAPVLQVRAGGIGNHYGAVVACSHVLGRDSEAVLGHLDSQSIAEILSGSDYENLRQCHIEERFDDISYCKGCDQLYDYPEALVWTNIPGREYNQSKGSKNKFVKMLDL